MAKRIPARHWVPIAREKMSKSIYVTFPLTSNFAVETEKLRVVAEKYNGMDVGSGAGFGQRDIHFEFKTKEAAVAAEKEMQKLDIPGLDVSND